MPERGLVHRVRAPVVGLVQDAVRVAVGVTLARTDGEDGARCVARPNDDVARPGRAVHEVPLPLRPLLALHDEQRLARENEEVLLVGLPVVHRHQLARREHVEAVPDLPEVSPPLQADLLPTSLAVEPARLGARSARTSPLRRA